MDKVTDLIFRLNDAIVSLNLSQKVFDVYFDEAEDIVTIILFRGNNKEDFYSILAASEYLKKDDQIAINWL